MKKTAFLSVLAVAALAGCTTPTQYIRDGMSVPAAAGLVQQDINEAVRKLTSSLLASGRLDRTDGGVYVMAVGKVVNDTNQQFNTDVLVDMITDELSASGKVLMTASYTGATDKPDRVDSTLAVTRSARSDAEFNQETVVKPGQLIAASLSISGYVEEKQTYTDGGKKQIDYNFRMRVVDQATGLVWWQNSAYIGKLTDRKNQTF